MPQLFCSTPGVVADVRHGSPVPSGDADVGRRARGSARRQQKALGMAWGFEAAHRPLALPRRLVRVLGTIVQTLVFALLDTWHHVLVGGLVAAELVRDEHARHVVTPI